MPTTVPGIDALSERQKEVLRLTARHHQVKEIAHLLKISENTVKTHLIETRRRLGASRLSRPSACYWRRKRVQVSSLREDTEKR